MTHALAETCLLTYLTTQPSWPANARLRSGQTTPVQIMARPLTANAFSSFGEVIEMAESPRVEAREPAERSVEPPTPEDDVPVAVSLVAAQPVVAPFMVWSIESHSLNSRTVLPLSAQPHVLVVAEDRGGSPGPLFAFHANGKQAVQYHAGIWHHAPLPIGRRQHFSVIESVEANAERGIERRFFERPWIIGLPG